MNNNDIYIDTMDQLRNYIKYAFVPASQKEAAAMPPPGMSPNMPPPGAMPPPGGPGMDPNMPPPGGDPAASMQPPSISPDEILKIIEEFSNANKQLENEVHRLASQVESNSQQLLDIQKSYAEMGGRIEAVYSILNGKQVSSGFKSTL